MSHHHHTEAKTEIEAKTVTESVSFKPDSDMHCHVDGGSSNTHNDGSSIACLNAIANANANANMFSAVRSQSITQPSSPTSASVVSAISHTNTYTHASDSSVGLPHMHTSSNIDSDADSGDDTIDCRSISDLSMCVGPDDDSFDDKDTDTDISDDESFDDKDPDISDDDSCKVQFYFDGEFHIRASHG